MTPISGLFTVREEVSQKIKVSKGYTIMMFSDSYVVRVANMKIRYYEVGSSEI